MTPSSAITPSSTMTPSSATPLRRSEPLPLAQPWTQPRALPWPAFALQWERAETALARLDEALSAAEPAVATAWLAAARLTEAARAAHLDRRGTSVERLAMLEADRAPAGHTELDDHHGLDVLATLRALDLLEPATILTAPGLCALWRRFRRLPPDETPSPEAQTALATWLTHWTEAPEYPALLRLALALSAWHRLTPAGSDSATLGRLLVPVLAWEAAKTQGPRLMISDRLAACPQRLDPLAPLDQWLPACLGVIADSAQQGRKNLSGLVLKRRRWQSRLAGHRGHSRLGAAADLALGVPLLSGRVLVDHLGVSPRGATLLLTELVKAGLVREITGRHRFRLFTAVG